MKLDQIIDKEELQIDSDKLRQLKICVDKLDDRLEDFIHSGEVNDEGIELLYKYNRYLKQNCRR